MMARTQRLTESGNPRNAAIPVANIGPSSHGIGSRRARAMSAPASAMASAAAWLRSAIQSGFTLSRDIDPEIRKEAGVGSRQHLRCLDADEGMRLFAIGIGPRGGDTGESRDVRHEILRPQNVAHRRAGGLAQRLCISK